MKKEKEKFILLKMIAMMTPPCEVIGQRVSESFDRTLTLRERMSIRIHNLGCVVCERYRRQMMTLHRILVRYVENLQEGQDLRMPDEAKQRIKDALHEQL